MDANPLVLRSGDQVFEFADFEVPPTLNALGGKQLHAVHQFIGGARAIQTYGSVPHERISWSGRFLGATGATRAKLLDAIRASGAQCTLTWSAWKYTGILAETGINPHFIGDIPYSAIFVPDTDFSGQTPFSAAVSPQVAYAATASKLTQNGAAYGGSTPDILRAIATVNALLQSMAVLLPANGGLISAIPGPQLAAVTMELSGVVETLEGRESAVILPAPPFAVAVSEIAASYADQLWIQAEIVQLDAMLYVLSLPTALLNVQTFVNPNLLLIAAAVYGDPDDYLLISEANGGFPVYAEGSFTLVLPAAT